MLREHLHSLQRIRNTSNYKMTNYFIISRALTEKIVKVLPSMKCPHTIEPHQIQGLDFINIYPLILWLIKYSSEFREAKEDELRKFAVMQYDKSHIFESDRAVFVQKEKLLRNLAVVQVK